MSKLDDKDPAVKAFTRVAQWVTSDMGHDMVTLATPKDSALGWKAAAVHPLQILATEYQAIVNDAARGMTDFPQRQRVESEAMGDFYLFDGGSPRLLGVGKGQGYDGERFPLAGDALSDASRKLDVARALVQTPNPVPAIQEVLNAALTQAGGVLNRFHALPMSDAWRVTVVDAAEQSLARAGAAIGRIMPPPVVEPICKDLASAISNLEAALEGVGSVQMFYSIERFYLFRLLVRYKLHSDNLITAGEITNTSGALTKLVTNGHAFLTDWLEEKIVDLNARVLAADPSGNTLFFLKGGRALNYALNTPQLGTNDWDTQIVINPGMPAERWYAIFLRVSNAVLLALQDYKTELYMLMYHSGDQFEKEVDTAEGDSLPTRSAKPADAYAYSANVKAELIDVGLPRFETVEGREQWHTLHGQLQFYPANGMPIPGYAYYINEYVMMTREVFAGGSPSGGKINKRVDRLFQVLSQAQVNVLAAGLAQTLAARVPNAVNGIAALNIIQPVKNALLFQLGYFCEAYRLDAEPRMAIHFDTAFTNALSNILGLATPRYPPGVRDALLASEQKIPPEVAPGCTALADSIAFCQAISNDMQGHLKARATALDKAVLDRFFRAFLARSIFTQTEELEIQLAGDFAYAAGRYAEYLQFERPGDLEPMTYLSLGIYCAQANSDPLTVRELIRPAIQESLIDTMGTLDVDDEYPSPANVIRIVWGQDIVVAPLAGYRPLAIEITVHTDPPRRPLLSHIWGLPVLSLRDLILGYQDRTARVEEFGMRARLSETIAGLSEMLMHAAHVQPPNRALHALARDDCHHLLISSASHAVGRSGQYPRSYHPDRDFQLMLTGNRRGFAAQFGFGAVA